MSVVDSKCYISVDVATNKNRWWKVELHDNDDVVTRWGRVGSEDSKRFPGAGRSFMDKKIREKERKGYTETKTVEGGSATTVKNVGNSELHSIAKAQLVKSSNPILDNLIQRFVSANVHKITENTTLTFNSSTGLFSTPLGIVTLDGIVEARTLLADIAKKVRKGKYDAQLAETVGLYLRIVPQKVGRKLIVEDLFPDDNAVQKQNDLLDSLESSYQAISTPAVAAATDKTAHPEVFKVDLDVLDDSKERKRLTEFYEKTKKSMHSYDSVKVREIFRVAIHEMDKAFDRKRTPLQEVFHGTSQANCLSILKSGLRVSPPSTAAIAGKLFGNGVYGSTSSSKSLGYTFGRWGQGNSRDAGWLFICDFAMGKIHYPRSSGGGLPSGYDSVHAKASLTGLFNDELIVYKNNQVNIKYLLECK